MYFSRKNTGSPLLLSRRFYRNGRIVAIASGGLIFFGLGTGEYNELAGKQHHRRCAMGHVE
jgi:hypothetical protein